MKSKLVKVLDSEMNYVEEGSGDPILFVHGNPTSSYLWRNITPAMEKYGRTIAVDLIGMGSSGKPDIEYRFIDHYRYLEEFIKVLNLKNITLVLHDWGSALGFHYCKNNPENVRGLAFMEAQIKLRYSDSLGNDAGFFNPLRDSITGPQMVIEENFFIEQALPGGMIVTLSKEEMDVYKRPYLTKESRKPLLRWVNEVPIDDTPADVAKVFKGYMDFLNNSPHPKLLLYVDGGSVVTKDDVNRLGKTMKNLETRYVGKSVHFIQEDCHLEICKELCEWFRRKLLTVS